MGIETRIGIVTGLLIVVVASVYFFYGNEPDEGAILVATGSKVSAAPKIPPTHDRQKTASDGKLSPSKRNQSTKTDSKKASPRATQRRPGVSIRNRPRISRPSPKHPTPRPPRPDVDQDKIATQDKTATEEKTAARDQYPTALGPLANPRKSTALRTGPSQDLVDATRENLDDRTSADTEAKEPLPIQPGQASRTRVSGASQPRRSPEGNPPTQTVSAWPKQHRISEGDTLVGIADLYYGSSLHFEEILKANPDIKNPRNLKIGTLLTIPAPQAQPHARVGDRPDRDGGRTADQPQTSRRSSTAPRMYTVREGDSFYSIARSRLNRGARWEEIFRLNAALVNNNPQGLKPGMVIRLPE